MQPAYYYLSYPGIAHLASAMSLATLLTASTGCAAQTQVPTVQAAPPKNNLRERLDLPIALRSFIVPPPDDYETFHSTRRSRRDHADPGSTPPYP